MQSKNAKRTQAQKDWQTDLAAMGCVLTHGPAEIDHLFGATAKANGEEIGQWACIPLSATLHRNNQVNRSSSEYAFNQKYLNGRLWNMNAGAKKELFLACCCQYLTYYKRKNLPFSEEVLLAIMSY